MNVWKTLRRWVLALAFAVLITPVYFTTWWINVKGLEPSSDSPSPQWDYYELIIENLPLVVTFGVAVCAATIGFLIVVRNSRRWWLVMGFWFWLVGLASPFLLLPLAKPWLFSNVSPGALLANFIIALFTAIIPGIVGILLTIVWLLVSFLIAR